jgi:hypothetical protein
VYNDSGDRVFHYCIRFFVSFFALRNHFKKFLRSRGLCPTAMASAPL